jgi:hypothetical protein
MEDKMQIPSRLSHVKCQLVCRIIALFMLGSVIKAAALPVVWINEIHYDNTGADSGEFVEIAGAAGTDLGGYQLVLYNGTGGVVYRTLDLAGTISSQLDGFGAVAFTFPVAIQNGSPDGIALVSPTDEIQFLSYEGAFTATDGPAVGITSTDIGVFEPDTSPLGYSLQLVGTGGNYADFVWSAPALASPGSINDGQYFTAASVPDGGTTLGLLGLGLLSLPGFLRRGRLFGS